MPLAAEHAVGVAITSYAGDLCLCVNADRDLVHDVDELVAGMAEELDALEALGSGLDVAAVGPHRRRDDERERPGGEHRGARPRAEEVLDRAPASASPALPGR